MSAEPDRSVIRTASPSPWNRQIARWRRKIALAEQILAAQKALRELQEEGD